MKPIQAQTVVPTRATKTDASHPAIRRRDWMLAATAVLCASPHAWANSFPSRALTLIVPFPSGGNIDIVGRGLAGPLGRALGQTLVVDNRGGGGGSVGAALLARARPDGHTLMVGVPSSIVTVPLLVKTPYTSEDFHPVGLVCRTSVVLVARSSDRRFNSLADVARLAKQRPGAVSIGHPGVGSPNHMVILQLENQFGASFNAIPYQGSAPALVDLQGGTLDLYVDQISSSMPYLKSGALQALVVFGPEQDPSLPAVPTMAQLGHSPIDATTYTGVFVPQGVPQSALDTLSSAVRDAVADPQFIAGMRALGSIAGFESSQTYSEMIHAEARVARQMLAEGRLKAD